MTQSLSYFNLNNAVGLQNFLCSLFDNKSFIPPVGGSREEWGLFVARIATTALLSTGMYYLTKDYI